MYYAIHLLFLATNNYILLQSIIVYCGLTRIYDTLQMFSEERANQAFWQLFLEQKGH